MRVLSVLSFVTTCAVLTGCAAPLSSQRSAVAAQGGDVILVRQSSKTPDQVIDAIKAYAESKKWVYMGSNRVKPPQGEVTMVKVCIPAVGAALWPLGLQMSALLPCGNLGIYQKDGRTEISMLDPRYMAMLVPSPEVSRASGLAGPLLTEMLDTVAK